MPIMSGATTRVAKSADLSSGRRMGDILRGRVSAVGNSRGGWSPEFSTTETRPPRLPAVPGYNPAFIVSSAGPVQFRVATGASEYEQIFELGYDTFVEEIPQHPSNGTRRHVDRFHDENTYL